MAETEKTNVRVHIGNVSESLAQSVDDLKSRLEKYGQVVGNIELRKKELCDTYYGYATINLTQTQWIKLKSSINGTVFKGSKLTISEARPDYKQRYGIFSQADQSRGSKNVLNDDQRKRLFSPAELEEGVLAGRERSSPRKDMKHMTVRITKGDRVVKLRCKKTKLWGYAKDKSLDTMVFRYENGLWKDSHGEIVESIRQGEPAEDAMEQVEIGSGDERQMNISVLESLFSKDIKPMPKVSISDDEHDRDEGSDINEEIELVIDDREGSNNIVQFSNTDDAAAPRPFTDVDWDEDDVEEAGHKDAPPGAALVNDTSTLRSLFNPPEESNSFRLFRGEDESSDIDEAELPDNEVMAPILRPVTVEEVPLVTQRGSVGLFFGHFESPFLYSQTQAAKMDAGVFDRNKWEEQFWTSRGDWNRELRKRRRDVSRQQRKRAMARSHRAAG